MLKLLKGIAAAMIGALSPESLAAADDVVAEPMVVAEPLRLMEVMRAAGYKVELKTVNVDTYIRAIRGKDSYKFNVVFYGCEENTTRDCKSVQFFAAFTPKIKPTLDAMNIYSRDHRWGRFYLDKENYAVIEMDVDLEQGGMSEALYLDNLEYFDTVMKRYADFVFDTK